MQYSATANYVYIFSNLVFYFQYRGVRTSLAPGAYWFEVDDGSTFDTDAVSVQFSYAAPLLNYRPAIYQEWTSGRGYQYGEYVYDPISFGSYICSQYHISDEFITDYLQSGYWFPLQPRPGTLIYCLEGINGTDPSGYIIADGRDIDPASSGDQYLKLLYCVLQSCFMSLSSAIDEWDAETVLSIPDLRAATLCAPGTQGTYQNYDGEYYSRDLYTSYNDSNRKHIHPFKSYSWGDDNPEATLNLDLNFEWTDPFLNEDYMTFEGSESKPFTFVPKLLLKY